MADLPIGSLEAALDVYDSDLFVLEQNGRAMKLTGTRLASFIDRNIISVTVTTLPASASPTATYNRITGNLVLGLPRGRGINYISTDNNGGIIFTYDDGYQQTVASVKGDTGKSAYDYAVENGYTGTEPEYAQLMVDLYNASLNEAERVASEAQRVEDYQYILDTTQEQLDKFDTLMRYADSIVINKTLLMYRGGVRLFDTTLML